MKTLNPSPVLSRSQRGFSLVELMVAITLGFIVIGAVGYLYLGSRQSFRTTDGMSRIQENARYALQTMAHDVRMAGFAGCGNLQLTPVYTDASLPVPALTPALAITGLDSSSGLGTVYGAAPGVTRVAGDAISVMGAFGGGINLAVVMPPTAAVLFVAGGNPLGFQPNDVLLITDCAKADIFRVTNVPGPSGALAHAVSNNFSPTLIGGPYGLDAFVMKMEQYTYFIGTNLSGGQSLYRDSLTEGTVELVDNVFDMQILYGVDTDSDGAADVYQTATVIGANWAQVVSARINLLMVSQDNVLSAKQTYNFNSAPPAVANDRRLYQVFTTTVGVRNRLL